MALSLPSPYLSNPTGIMALSMWPASTRVTCLPALFLSVLLSKAKFDRFSCLTRVCRPSFSVLSLFVDQETREMPPSSTPENSLRPSLLQENKCHPTPFRNRGGKDAQLPTKTKKKVMHLPSSSIEIIRTSGSRVRSLPFDPKTLAPIFRGLETSPVYPLCSLVSVDAPPSRAAASPPRSC